MGVELGPLSDFSMKIKKSKATQAIAAFSLSDNELCSIAFFNLKCVIFKEVSLINSSSQNAISRHAHTAAKRPAKSRWHLPFVFFVAFLPLPLVISEARRPSVVTSDPIWLWGLARSAGGAAGCKCKPFASQPRNPKSRESRPGKTGIFLNCPAYYFKTAVLSS